MTCETSLGLENMKLEDSAFDASSSKGTAVPHMGRLNSITGNGRVGGWRANVDNNLQWLRVCTLSFVAFCMAHLLGKGDFQKWKGEILG